MSRTCDIWMAQGDHQRLMAHLFPGDRDEHGAVLRCGIVETSTGLRMVVRDVMLAIDGKDYVPGRKGYRELRTDFIMANIKACRDQRLAYLALHNHDCDRAVDFSSTDMQSHETGYGALRDIGRGVPVGALVFGRRSVEADIWLPDGRRLRLGEFRVIGSAIQRFYASPRAVAAGAAPEVDRQVRMFGSAGQALLKRASVAVIGLGGVGSLVSEYLARLGAGHLLLIDPDAIEDTNLSRVVGATAADVRAKRPKVEIAARVALAAQPEIDLTCRPADVADCTIAAELTGCDYIILAADSMRARLVTNAIAQQYFVPVIQLGAKVQPGSKDELADAMSVIRNIRPGQGCLWCNGLIDSGQLAIESKSDEERKAQAYGTNEPNPSVITMNAVAAAHGVNDFLFDYLGLREISDTQYERHHFLWRNVKRTVASRAEGCPECGRRYGMGDALPLPCVTKPTPAVKDRSVTLRSRFWAWLARLLS